MSAMRWFRKHNKKIMVIAGCVLMVAFLLPAAFFRGSGKNPAEQVVATFKGSEGKEVEITQGMLEAAENELKALQMLKISEFYLMLLDSSTPQEDRAILQNILQGMAGIGQGPVKAAHLLLFSSQISDLRSTYYIQQSRDELLRKADVSNWTDDPESLTFLKESIQQLAGIEAKDSAFYYLLLAQEAQQMGIRPPIEAVDKLLELRTLQRLTIANILDRHKLREVGQLKMAVANYIAIVRYCDLITKILDISEPQLKKNIRDQIQQKNISGTYVTFPGYQFRERVGEPKLEALQEQLDQYKSYAPEQTEENPHGFGYSLPDRIKIEYLMIDLGQVRTGIEALHGREGILERKKLEQTYWEQDRSGYLRQYKARQNRPEDAAEETNVNDTEDERNARLEWEREKVWQKRQAYTTAQDLLTKAKEKSQSILSISALKQLPPDQRVGHVVEYAALAQELKPHSDPNEPEIIYNPDYDGNYFSANQMYQLRNLSGAYLPREKQSRLQLMDILFQCKPLHQGILTRLDETPVELYEDIGPLESFQTGSDGAVYLVRVVGVDPTREPVSLYDDGSGGAAFEAPDPNENNSLYLQVKRDWQSLQQFSLAVDEANRFVELSDPNWAGAITQVNADHQRDPNLPGPLREDLLDNSEQRIESLMQQMTRLQENIQTNPQMAQFAQYQLQSVQRQIMEIYQLRLKAMELAQERADKNEEGRAVLERKDNMSCAVFKDLKLQPVSQQEYLRQKALHTYRTIQNEQEMLAVIHLAPDSIEKRTGFERQKEKGE
jgi:hypothetical protein